MATAYPTEVQEHFYAGAPAFSSLPIRRGYTFIGFARVCGHTTQTLFVNCESRIIIGDGCPVSSGSWTLIHVFAGWNSLLECLKCQSDVELDRACQGIRREDVLEKACVQSKVS